MEPGKKLFFFGKTLPEKFLLLERKTPNNLLTGRREGGALEKVETFKNQFEKGKRGATSSQGNVISNTQKPFRQHCAYDTLVVLNVRVNAVSFGLYTKLSGAN